MKGNLYWSLAWSGMQKNRRLYLPYCLTCVGMVMMCYIIGYLSSAPNFVNIRGGATMRSVLGLGFFVVCIFAAIFLFYTNSFLVRRRKREFGLYNVLGLGKKHLAAVLFLETLLIAAMTLAAGLFFGILFSKFAELAMLRILGETGAFSFVVDLGVILRTVGLFLAIFALIFLNTLRQIQLSNPIALLRSEHVGEKPPRANWAVALLGAAMLVVAYVLAVRIENPIAALTMFFVAVILVVVATYLLFLSGSVALCRLLQKNPHYYYKTKHFVSVSTMAYRMKRNGAGLASICILSTMVLVMLSSTACLYIGGEDALRNRFPRNIGVEVSAPDIALLGSSETDQVRETIVEVVAQEGETPENVLTFRTAAFAGLLDGTQMQLDPYTSANDFSQISQMWQVYLIPLADYNRMTGEEEILEPGQALLYLLGNSVYDADTITLGDSVTLEIKKRVSTFEDNIASSTQVIASMFLFVDDLNDVMAAVDSEEEHLSNAWYYGFDLACGDEKQTDVEFAIADALHTLEKEGDGFTDLHVMVRGVASERGEFYAIYGGLFFLGILLGVVFLFAAVLIVYYKQISEGYEDQARFAILQDVGMTKREIRASINSQVRTVFFLPLLTAGVHLAFAFPMIHKMLLIFDLTNFKLLVLVTCGCYLLFALFYALVYRGTSRAYFSIVSGMRGEAER